MRIIGAGLTGLIAGHAFPTFPIYDRDGPRQHHKALLRFRTDAVSRVTNIPFRKVMVRKAIYDLKNRAFVEPNIRYANEYSQKVLGRVLDRSIWNLEPCWRYIAPEDFYERLIANLGNRISWETPMDPFKHPNGCISTIPMLFAAEVIGSNTKFEMNDIYVYRFRIRGAEVYQTVYFPNIDQPIYRASITGDILIVESVDKLDPAYAGYTILSNVFGIEFKPEVISSDKQHYGKIAPIEERERRRIIVELTRNYRIYSLGRFATWRNILLDDVINDIDVIKGLLNADDYSHALKV